MAEAAATVRIVAGTVDGMDNGKILRGAGFYVQRTNTGNYYISFDPVFTNLYGASATVVRGPPGVISTMDGCQLMDIANNALYVTTGNASGRFNDQVFSFIVVGV